MTDIVERLRRIRGRYRGAGEFTYDMSGADVERDEAADEIERLRAVLRAIADSEAVPAFVRTLANQDLTAIERTDSDGDKS